MILLLGLRQDNHCVNHLYTWLLKGAAVDEALQGAI